MIRPAPMHQDREGEHRLQGAQELREEEKDGGMPRLVYRGTNKNNGSMGLNPGVEGARGGGRRDH